MSGYSKAMALSLFPMQESSGKQTMIVPFDPLNKHSKMVSKLIVNLKSLLQLNMNTELFLGFHVPHLGLIDVSMTLSKQYKPTRTARRCSITRGILMSSHNLWPLIYLWTQSVHVRKYVYSRIIRLNFNPLPLRKQQALDGKLGGEAD